MTKPAPKSWQGLDWRLVVRDGFYRGETCYATRREALEAQRAAKRKGSLNTEIQHRPGKAHRVEMPT